MYLKECIIAKRERSEEEKLRRHLYGEKGAKFSAAKIPSLDWGGGNWNNYDNGNKRPFSARSL